MARLDVRASHVVDHKKYRHSRPNVIILHVFSIVGGDNNIPFFRDKEITALKWSSHTRAPRFNDYRSMTVGIVKHLYKYTCIQMCEVTAERLCGHDSLCTP